MTEYTAKFKVDDVVVIDKDHNGDALMPLHLAPPFTIKAITQPDFGVFRYYGENENGTVFAAYEQQLSLVEAEGEPDWSKPGQAVVACDGDGLQALRQVLPRGARVAAVKARTFTIPARVARAASRETSSRRTRESRRT